MEVHPAQATPPTAPSNQPPPPPPLTFPFIGDFLPSSVLTTSDYGSDCSSLAAEVSLQAKQEPVEDSSVYIPNVLRTGSDLPSNYGFSVDENLHSKPESPIVVCAHCQLEIQEKFFLTIDGRSLHENCLQCKTCETGLTNKCYYKKSNFYCKGCYFREYGSKCSSCDRVIQSTDWVRRAHNFVYHLACFACNQCRRQLSTGEEYALQEGKLLCKQHFVELVEGESGISSQKAKTKRVRTTFAEDQLSVLQTYFNRDSNPDGADLEKIATITGLSKRVTQVWFQNSRARQKKWHQKSEGDNGSQRSSVGPMSPGQKSDSSNDMMYPTSVTTSAEDAIPDTVVCLSMQFD